jgi:flagellar basal-body rod protein FlgF
MPGTQYVALSGLRARADQLDRLASDIANIGTSGYKAERQSRSSAERPAFNDALQTAIDTTSGGTRLDMTNGALAPTGRPLDVALDGPGFFVVQTAAGDRYTRNGHFTLNKTGQIATDDGALVQGENGPLKLGPGEIKISEDGSVTAGDQPMGKLKIVTFADPGRLALDGTTMLRADGQEPEKVATPVVRGGQLEQSNVSVSTRLAELTTVSRGFEALQKCLSLMMNDVDGRAIEQLGRR